MTRPRPDIGQAFRVINERQQVWARNAGIPFASDYSVEQIDENLFRPLRPETRNEIASGDGKELDGKLKKLCSSAALVANVFDYWRNRTTIAGACFDLPEARRMSFEKVRSIFDGILREDPERKNPNIDLELAGDETSGSVALECKFTEPFVIYPQTRRPFTSTYFCPAAEPIWAGMDRTRALAIRLNDESPLFTRLEAPQLIKTALACKRNFRSGRWRLVYVWFEVVGDPLAAAECRFLLDELNDFREQTHGEIPLEVTTWQEVFLRLKARSDLADSSYIAYLHERYFQHG
ncbi:MAG TPA: hypothetical protein VGU25_07880 [Acidobacteriaceae bacterium]|nr:hypothetical protein [Acidobacteriaceae bacterium]